MVGVGGPRRGGPSPFPSLEVGWRGKEMEVEVRGVPRDPPQSPVEARCRGSWEGLQPYPQPGQGLEARSPHSPAGGDSGCPLTWGVGVGHRKGWN